MNLKYVIAIIRPDVLAALETKLGSLHVRGLTVTKVKGFGEYTDFFSKKPSDRTPQSGNFFGRVKG
ncbi:P-II family nitrogen regulator [Undibacterium arcticum]